MNYTEPKEVIAEISKIFLNNYNRNFDEFLDIVLFALESREEEYMQLVKRLDREIVMDYAKAYTLTCKFFYFEQKFWDILGEVYMQVTSRSKMNGEFYTTYHIWQFMVEMTSPKLGEKVCDPCSGSGAMLIATKEYIWKKYKVVMPSIHLFGMDISSNAIKMAKIQNYLTDYDYMGCLLLSKAMEIKSIHEKK